MKISNETLHHPYEHSPFLSHFRFATARTKGPMDLLPRVGLDPVCLSASFRMACKSTISIWILCASSRPLFLEHPMARNRRFASRTPPRPSIQCQPRFRNPVSGQPSAHTPPPRIEPGMEIVRLDPRLRRHRPHPGNDQQQLRNPISSPTRAAPAFPSHIDPVAHVP